MSKSKSENRKSNLVLDWLLNRSLKSKLLGALSLLVFLNGFYFYFNARSVFELNRLILSMYDNVVMSGTYSQMAKNDFARYCEAVHLSLTSPDSKTFREYRAQVEEADTSLSENLKVVEERTLKDEDKVAIRDLAKVLDKVDAETDVLLARYEKAMKGREKLSAESMMELDRAWSANPGRRHANQMLTDFADKVVADGYAFRLNSVERSDFIGKTSTVFAVAVILINIACMVLILLSVLPRLRRLTNACVEIVSGNHSKRVLLRSHDEFGTLASSFNSMLDIIAERENQIRTQLFTTNAMVDSLAQGFLIFDRSGVCLPVFSKACVDLLEVEPAGLPIVEVLKVTESEREVFNDWVEVLFSGAGTFSELAQLYPLFLAHSKHLTIALDYRPLYNNDGDITHIVMIATDQTRVIEAKAAADKEQAFSKMISNLLRNRTQFSRFLIETDKMIKEIAQGPSPSIFRTLHTMKGGAATFSIGALKDMAHTAEFELAQTPTAAKAREVSFQLRKEYDRTLLELFNTCAFLIDNGELKREFPVRSLIDFYRSLKTIPGANNLSETFAESFLLEPVLNFFIPFEESVQELAVRLGKKVKPLKIEGGSLRVFGENYAPLFASFVHLFRNAIDHGIESAPERLKAGKEPIGSISVEIERFKKDGRSWIKIAVKDDGRGINIDRLREKLIAKDPQAQSMTDHEIMQKIFDAGVSTAATQTDISGRGVGTDAVLSSAIALGGTAWVESTFGKGTVVTVTVPETSIPERLNRAA